MCSTHTACHTQTVFYSGQMCSFPPNSCSICQHRSYYRSCITNTPPSVLDPMLFLLPYGIASKLYWSSVFCYRYETSNLACYLESLPEILPDCSVSVPCQRVLGKKKPFKLLLFVNSTIDALSALPFSPVSPHQFCTLLALCWKTICYGLTAMGHGVRFSAFALTVQFLLRMLDGIQV
jgi:hypothetical protein